MNLLAEIYISSEETRNPNIRGWVHNVPFELLKRISELGYALEPRGREEYYAVKVREAADSVKVQEIRKLLNSAGLVEYTKHTIFPKDLRISHYAFKFIRKFTKSEIDSAQYLRMNINGLGYIASHADTTADGYVLRVDKKQKNTLAIGWLSPIITPFASDTGRAELEKHHFKGLEFFPAIFDKPEKVTKPLWMLTSSITLPPCLLPVQNQRGEIVDPNTEEGERIWDDAGRVLPVLRYDRGQIQAIGEFDIAKTRELIGGMRRHYRHHYVVSQRFRKAIIDGKHRWIDFVPVEVA